MAKRKRLTPAQPSYLSAAPERKSALGTPLATAAPIAQVASDAAAQAALSELSAVLESARADGRLIERITLEQIDETHLVRDRLEQAEDEMGALIASLRARGQQTAIEVVVLRDRPDGKTHGLISGWRRLSALKRLYAETSESKFASIKALVIHPESARDAYVAMVEENEIRVNLSHYERARIAVRALREGVYPNQKMALQGLFANATRAKRSKIGSFVALVEALDAVLMFPVAINEKLGLSLVREITRDPSFTETLTSHLRAGERDTPVGELRILSAAVSAAETAALTRQSEAENGATPVDSGPRIRDHLPAKDERINTQVAPGLRLGYTPGKHRIELSGSGVDETLIMELREWLLQRR
ncbi:MAG: chromosome partitioning protein ParB [Rhodobacteraceae bacterium]|nr:MAG: chromosome partitioning protein ParB [Paracoccaceae bacterium]